MGETPVTGFRLGERELELLDDAAVSRSELVRFLIVSGLDQPGGDLGLVADVLADLAENCEDLSEAQEQVLFRSVSVLRGVAQRSDGQASLQRSFSEARVEGL